MADRSAVFTFKLPSCCITVSNENINDIMKRAMSFCPHWCETVTGIDISSEKDEHKQISKGGKLKFYPSDGRQPVVLDKQMLRKGLYKWLLSLRDPSKMEDNGRLDMRKVDAFDADMILQYALFGEVIYGALDRD